VAWEFCTNVRLHKFAFVIGVFKTLQKKCVIAVREEMKSKQQILERCNYYALAENQYSLRWAEFVHFPLSLSELGYRLCWSYLSVQML